LRFLAIFLDIASLISRYYNLSGDPHLQEVPIPMYKNAKIFAVRSFLLVTF